MSKYVKLPVEIEAMQWTRENEVALSHWLLKYDYDCKVEYDLDCSNEKAIISEIRIPTLEGVMKASLGDYIIKGVNGEFYPCKPDIFEKTYRKVGD